MEIITYSEENKDILNSSEPMLAAISFDGSKAYVSLIDDAVEHNILLEKVGVGSINIDKYFRIVFDRESADWTFVCPPDYKNIRDKQKRIQEFYKDGFDVIAEFLAEIGYFSDITIPRRYRRHFDMM